MEPRVNVLIQPEAIQAAVRLLGRQIGEDYRERELVLVGVLKGSLFFLADLARAIPLQMEIGFLMVSSYGASRETSGEVRIDCDLDLRIENRDVLVVEDIVDTGLTLAELLRHLTLRRPRSLRVCALLDKPANRRVPVPIHYTGFSIEDRFVVGYGLDLDQKYRNLPYIGYLEDPCPSIPLPESTKGQVPSAK